MMAAGTVRNEARSLSSSMCTSAVVISTRNDDERCEKAHQKYRKIQGVHNFLLRIVADIRRPSP